jgi:1,2-diacylglycerol 3-alpha-glucosyltransferase
MKKILILIDTMKPTVDGVSIFLDNILPFLTQKYEVTIIASASGNGTYENVKLINFPVYKISGGIYGPPKINKKLLEEEVKKCDFIFNHESVSPFSTSFYAIRYAKKYKKPFFTYLHSIDWELITEAFPFPFFIKFIGKRILIKYSRWFLGNCNAIIVPFDTIKNILLDNYIKGNFEIVPVGVSNEFKPGKSKFIGDNRIIIGYTGRVSLEKRLDTLLNSFLKLNNKLSYLYLLIVGDGPYSKILKEQKNVKVTGFVSQTEVADYLRAMDIFVLPSITETSSISTLEAMKTGVCCIARNVGCIKDYLKDGYNGFFFENDNELEILLEKLIQNQQLRNEIGKKASDSVLEYTWENTSNKLIYVFEKYL